MMDKNQKPSNQVRCKVCDGSGKYYVEVPEDIPPRTLYVCDNCEGKGFLKESDPKSLVKMPKWV